MDDCIFCKIAKGEIPCQLLWNNSDFICFFDINPVSKGHCLIIPKKHYEKIEDIPDGLLARLIIETKDTAKMIIEKFEAKGYNIVQNNGKVAGQEVPHLHFHLIPRYENDDSDVIFKRSSDESIKNISEVIKELK